MNTENSLILLDELPTCFMNPTAFCSPYRQGTDEWLTDRAGVVTASNMKKVISKGRGKAPSLTRIGYMRELATEIVTGKPITEGFKSKWMERGTNQEEESRDYYAFSTGNTVKTTGLIFLDELKRIGASVDGLIDAAQPGNLELKNPKLTTHVGYLLDGGVPAAYKPQVQTQLWVTGNQWCDFASYHPDSHKMLYRFRAERDDEYIATLKTATYLFIAELDLLVEKLRAM